MSPGEIRLKGLHNAVPTRKSKHGPRPGVKSKEVYEPEDRDEEHSLWRFKKKEFSENEKKNIIGATLQIAIAASFHLHLYTFGEKVYMQMSGGPIGSRLTMAVSKIVMLVWGRKLQEHLGRAGLKTFIEGVYVDDIRLLMSLLSPHIRWDMTRKDWVDDRIDRVEEVLQDQKKMQTTWDRKSKCWKRAVKSETTTNSVIIVSNQSDKTNDDDEVSTEQLISHTKSEVIKVMNSIFSYLEFTLETCL